MIEVFVVLASVYCDEFVLNDKRMNCKAHTAAHRTLPIGTCIRINSLTKFVNALINDRGPCFSKKCKAERPDLLKRELDLSTGTAAKLGFKDGVKKVKFWIVKRKECK